MIDFNKYTLQELRAISEVMDALTSKEVELESWQFACLFRSTAREAFRAESAAIDQQAREAAKVQLSSLYGKCAADTPSVEDPAALRDLQALVDDLYRCSARLAALADGEDEHFAECSRVDVFDKVMLLRGGGRAVGELAANICDNYDGLH